MKQLASAAVFSCLLAAAPSPSPHLKPRSLLHQRLRPLAITAERTHLPPQHPKPYLRALYSPVV